MKIGKYEFKDEATALSKIKSLGTDTDEDGNEYPTHGHAIVKLGHIVLEQGEYDEEGNETKAPVLSDKYHLDVAWKGLEEHPYGWKSSAVTISDGNGVHSFYGIDYQNNKI
jgi:hypothetical protein